MDALPPRIRRERRRIADVFRRNCNFLSGFDTGSVNFRVARRALNLMPSGASSQGATPKLPLVVIAIKNIYR
jgi:hypothetical protein